MNSKNLKITVAAVAALAAAIHKGEWMTKAYLKKMEGDGQIHLAKWVPAKSGDRTVQRATYRIGPGKRAERPTRQEVKRAKYAEKRKDDPMFLPRHAAKERVRIFKPKPDIAAAWLFGNV